MRFKVISIGSLFLASRKFIKGICGPVGGGKSTVALMDLFNRVIAQEPYDNVRRTKVGILRNTSAQLRATVKPLIDTWFGAMVRGQMGRWTQTQGMLVFEARFKLNDGTVVHSDFMMLAADTPDDVRRLLSLELSFAWVEESREVDPEVFSGLQGRVNRYPSRAMGGVTYPGVIFSTNPPPLGTFWHEMLTKPAANAQVFMQPPALLENGSINPDAENLENLAPDYYENLIEGKTEEWVNVYLRNKFGQGGMGRPVFRSSFKPSFHVSKDTLKAVPQSIAPLVIGMDNGLQAAAVMMQQDMRGRVNALSECFVPEDETMGVETFLDHLLIPHLRARYPMFKPASILFSVDPACYQRSQVNEETIAQAIQKRGFNVVRASTNDPERRVQSVEGLLGRQIDGQAGMLIDPSCVHLADALSWGYRYKATSSGALAFEKNHYSHTAEAFQYGCLSYNSTAPAVGKTHRRSVVKSGHVYANV